MMQPGAPRHRSAAAFVFLNDAFAAGSAAGAHGHGRSTTKAAPSAEHREMQ